jgi:hypothetical protein
MDKLTLLFCIIHLMSREIALEAEVRKKGKNFRKSFYIPNGDKQNIPEETDHYKLQHVNK